MAEAIPPIVWAPEEEEGGVLLTWAGWAELVLELVVLMLWGPEEVLEELEVWEEEEEEATTGLRWDNSELSKDCSDRYGAEKKKISCHFHRSCDQCLSLKSKSKDVT